MLSGVALSLPLRFMAVSQRNSIFLLTSACMTCPGLVETSTNLASVKPDSSTDSAPSAYKVNCSTRSSLSPALEHVRDSIARLSRLVRASYQTSEANTEHVQPVVDAPQHLDPVPDVALSISVCLCHRQPALTWILISTAVFCKTRHRVAQPLGHRLRHLLRAGRHVQHAGGIWLARCDAGCAVCRWEPAWSRTQPTRAGRPIRAARS